MAPQTERTVMDKEQILALAKKVGIPLALFGEKQIEFYNAAIESYKAELLKEVGEPVARTTDRDWISTGEGTWLGRIESHLPLEELQDLHTSDQVAAAILKATKPLEERIQRRMDDIRLQAERQVALEDKCRDLSAQLAAAKEEIESLQGAVEELTRKYQEHAGEKYALQDQLAAAQEEIERLKATPPDKREDLRCVISDLCHQVRERDAQLAKAEQRVAEACAELADKMNPFPEPSAIGPEIRSGEWRKFVKEV